MMTKKIVKSIFTVGLTSISIATMTFGAEQTESATLVIEQTVEETSEVENKAPDFRSFYWGIHRML